jgi:hypothetical protein
MTIEYKDSKRIVGLSTDILDTVDYENTSAVSLGTGDSGTSIDLTGSTLDNSWILRFKVTMTSLGTGSSLTFMVQNSTTTTVSTARDGIGLRQTDSSSYYDFEGCNAVAGNAGQYDYRFTSTSPAVDTKYVQITRTSATSAKIEFYDSTYTTASDSSSDITIADITGLRYFVISNNGSALTVDDIDFWNGTVTNKPTNVQDNSLLVEKDTARRYWFDDAFNKTGLKAYYKFDEASGNIINQATSVGSVDSIGTGADLIVTGATYSATGIIGDALSYDGVDDYSKAGADSGAGLTQFAFMLGNNSLFTICGWFKSGAVDQDYVSLFNNWNNAAGTNKSVGIRLLNSATASKYDFNVLSGDGTSYWLNNTFTAVVDDDSNWHFYCLRVDEAGGSNNIGLSIDGGVFSTATASTANATTSSEKALTFGAYAGTLNLNMNMLQDETSIWNRVLTDAEITTIYNSGTGKTLDTAKSATWTMQPTYPYSSTGWSATGGGAVATDNLTLALDTDGGQDQVNYDLTSISSDKFVLDFTLNFSRLTVESNLFWFMGLVNSTNWITAGSTNHMGIFAMQEPATKVFACSDGTTTWNGVSEDAQSWVPSTGVDYYFRLTKLTSTTYKVELFDDSARTSVTSTSDGTVSSMTDLRYLVFTGDNNVGAGNATFTISDLKFYDGVTSIN